MIERILLGPRQVGKTTLARAPPRERGDRALYLDLEREADRRRLDDGDGDGGPVNVVLHWLDARRAERRKP